MATPKGSTVFILNKPTQPITVYILDHHRGKLTVSSNVFLKLAIFHCSSLSRYSTPENDNYKYYIIESLYTFTKCSGTFQKLTKELFQ